MLFSRQIIDTGTVGEDGWTEALGTLYAKSSLVVYLKTQTNLCIVLCKCSLTATMDFPLQKSSTALVHELTPLLSVKSFLIGKRWINAQLQQKAVEMEAESTDLNPS